MRFSVPRSLSPSPERRDKKTIRKVAKSKSPRPSHTLLSMVASTSNPTRRKMGFGAPGELSSESESGSEPESDASVSEQASSSEYSSSEESDEEPIASSMSRRRPLAASTNQTPAEVRQLEEALASVRLHTRHTDPYEEWSKQTRADAFRAAQDASRQDLRALQARQADARAASIAAALAARQAQADTVAAQLRQLSDARAAEEAKLRGGWKRRDEALWERVERVVKDEEARARGVREAEERKRKEEEAKREAERKRVEEERRRAEEAAKKKKEEETARVAEEKRKREQEEADAKRAQEEIKVKDDASKNEEHERRAIGTTTALEDWKRARETLRRLKTGPIAVIKRDKLLKPQWNAIRRQITPKVGQLTNDNATILRVTDQIFKILRPEPALGADIYIASLSSLSKVILLQAETEVTATEKAAAPLAQVTAHLLGALPSFADVFWARAVQRSGGWLVPSGVPLTDFDGVPMDDATRRKALGYRAGEGTAELGQRCCGIARVYFEILLFSTQTSDPLDPLFRLPRAWTWLARLLAQPRLLEAAVAPQVLHVALAVIAPRAKDIWGRQFVKLLAVLYGAIMDGLGDAGLPGKVVGGDAPEGKSARVRVQIEVEKVMGM